MSNDTQPEIRFPGFTEDWEERKLGEVVQIVMGQSPNSENYTDNPNDYILVQGNADMKNNRVVPRVWTTQVTKQAEKGDLILSVRAPVGDIGKTDYDVVLGRGVAAIKGNDFIFQQLGKMKENGYWNRYSTGSTFESINSNDIREALITIPDVKEQQKIGAFFKQLDDTIALQQRKLDLLKETKKGFLQKMFPKNGAKVPEIRFPGFTEDWEQRKVGEIFKVTRGQVLAATETSESITEKNIYPVYSSQTKNDGLMGYYSDYLFDTAITWTTDGANAGTVNYRNGKFYSTNVNGVLLSDKGYANKAVAETINRIAWKHVSKVGNPKLMNNVMSEIIITIPSVEEQETISRFFTQLDSTITLHERELDLLKETKKGFLQKMFV
ncbi:restriction endonuclease subunit S [Enterococcus hirae]|uniref:restriction endonuclease subunit S n=1 Tax=Enterococcus hirae TaxID=1354 RepID=UPI001CBD8E1B|nr:restriction endonuclease subunit S [Enterococcus hirae]